MSSFVYKHPEAERRVYIIPSKVTKEGKERGREGEGKGRRRVILLRKLKSNLVSYVRTSLQFTSLENDLNLLQL